MRVDVEFSLSTDDYKLLAVISEQLKAIASEHDLYMWITTGKGRVYP